MTNIEDKILGYKIENYCSSSDEDSLPDRNEIPINRNEQLMKTYEYSGNSQQTGPKGVIEDFKDFTKYKQELKDKKEKEFSDNLVTSAFSCLSSNDEDTLKLKMRDIEKNVEEDMDADDKQFFEQYKQKKMKELLATISNLPKFGHVINIDSGNRYLEHNVLCQYINSLMDSFARAYPYIKFCCANSNVPGISKNFSIKGVPALLVYKHGELIGNYVRLQDNLKINFGFNDLEQFLKDNGILSAHETSSPHL
ncbi:phosducin-like protein isoform X2 [Gordionus sp. m RMFG-2023]|uniref:phosducin-like protein isoform X2 n=1 Tax=Gordionus sp. m RMFG-2023 TaxID=3053472 RepID=UPI0031FC8475